MFLFSIESKINPRASISKELPDIGGAYVNCYISFKDFAVAEKLARLLIRDEGWIPEKPFEAWKLRKSELTRRDRQYYAEALKYGYCLVFHMWPKNAPDANDEPARPSNRPTRKKQAKRAKRSKTVT